VDGLEIEGNGFVRLGSLLAEERGWDIQCDGQRPSVATRIKIDQWDP